MVGMAKITPNTVGVVPFTRHELCNTGSTINPSKMAALPPKGHVPTPEEPALFRAIGVRVTEMDGVEVVRVSISNTVCAVHSAVEVVRDRGLKKHACLRPRMPENHSASLIAASSMVKPYAIAGTPARSSRDSRTSVILRERAPSEPIDATAP